MNAIPEIKKLIERKLVGQKMEMSFSQNKTRELWQAFMPHVREISNRVDDDLYSIEIYHDSILSDSFSPDKSFEKWAAVRVSDFESIPERMEALILPEGDYAVFNYRGKPSDASDFYRYIFYNWLPDSGYSLDNRPHFALMGEKYKGEDPDSEEELWIPISKK